MAAGVAPKGVPKLWRQVAPREGANATRGNAPSRVTRTLERRRPACIPAAREPPGSDATPKPLALPHAGGPPAPQNNTPKPWRRVVAPKGVPKPWRRVVAREGENTTRGNAPSGITRTLERRRPACIPAAREPPGPDATPKSLALSQAGGPPAPQNKTPPNHGGKSWPQKASPNHGGGSWPQKASPNYGGGSWSKRVADGAEKTAPTASR